MTSEPLQRVQAIFEQALELTGDSRTAFLDHACEGDRAMRAELDKLLREDAGSDLDIRGAIRSAADRVSDETTISWTGRQVGNYQLIECIAEGGMGTVYLARRADSNYEQQVAIKLLSTGVLDPQSRQRFVSERQILASLDHPNIARLLDGGTTDGGVPFLVMEFIAGQPIDQFCESRAYNVNQRLALFRKVCAAVAYAHRNLIIHRDLKPANILVGENGEPKLLDFGIAKLLDDSHFEQTVAVTRADMAVMTPNYASPEQVQRQPITTSSDIYSLGLVLYQLLVGDRAYSLSGLSPAQVEQVICESQPSRPSTAVLKNTELAEGAGALRTTATASLISKRLSGDIDTIVMKALAKEPEQRYATASALSADIARELAGMPVTAREPTWSYLAGKFIRRNTQSVAAVIAALAVLVGLVSFYTLQLAAERDAANMARENEALERRHAEQVVTFMTGLFRISDPNESKGNEVRAREILDAGAARISDELADQPLLQSRLMETMAEVYQNLGLFQQGLSLQQQALLQLERELGDQHLEVARALDRVGDLHYELGQQALAASTLERSLAIKEALLTPPDPSLALGLANASWLAYEEGRTAEALDYGKRSLAMRADIAGENPSRENRLALAEGQNNLAAVLLDMDQPREAELLFRQALKVRQEILGDAQMTAYSLGNLAEATRQQRRYEETWDYAQQSLAMRRRILEDTHPNVTDALNFLAVLHYTLGEFAAARDRMREVISLNRRGKQTWYTAYYQSNLGAALLAVGEQQEALGVLNEAALKFGQAGFGDSLYNASNLSRLGAAHLAEGDLATAQEHLEQALRILRASRLQDSPDTALAESLLGECLTLQGDSEGARPLLERSYAVLAKHWGEESWYARAAADRLAAINPE